VTILDMLLPLSVLPYGVGVGVSVGVGVAVQLHTTLTGVSPSCPENVKVSCWQAIPVMVIVTEFPGERGPFGGLKLAPLPLLAIQFAFSCESGLSSSVTVHWYVFPPLLLEHWLWLGSKLLGVVTVKTGGVGVGDGVGDGVGVGVSVGVGDGVDVGVDVGVEDGVGVGITQIGHAGSTTSVIPTVACPPLEVICRFCE